MKRILIVEDEPCLRFLYRNIINKETEIDEVIDGFEALELLEEKKYDLILLDLNLPIMNGIEILRKVRNIERNKKVAVIILSALGGDKYKEEAKELKVKEYLEKPVDFEILKSKIVKWCN